MKKLGASIYNSFAKVANVVITMGLLIVILFTMFISNIFNGPKLGYDRVEAIVVSYNDETDTVYMEYEYKGDTMAVKIKSGLTIPVGHLVTLDIDKDNPAEFIVVDTNLVTDVGHNKISTIAAIALVVLILYKMMYGPFIKQKAVKQDENSKELKN